MRRILMTSAVLGLIPIFMSIGLSTYRVEVLTIAYCYALFAVSLDLQWGQGGTTNLGPALAFGIGGYSAGLLLSAGLPLALACPLTAVIGALVAGGIGLGTFRSRAHTATYGLTLLAASLATEQLIIYLYDWTGGSNGTRIAIQKTALLHLRWEYVYLYSVATTVVIITALVALFSRTQSGLILACTRDQPDKAAVLGINVVAVRIFVAMIAAGLASLAGALFVVVHGIAHPSLFGVDLNVSALVWVVMGGRGSVFGPFVAAFVMKVIQAELGSHWEHEYVLAVSALLCTLVLWYPKGLAGAFRLLHAREIPK